MLDDDIIFLGSSIPHTSTPRPAQRPVTGVSLHVENQGSTDGYSMLFRRSNTSQVHIGRRSGADTDTTRSDAAEVDSAMFRCAVVSRKHAKIAFSDSGHAYLIDLGSHHGTHIRKRGDKFSKMIKPETPIVLVDSDFVTFGKSVGKGEDTVMPVTVRIELHHGGHGDGAPFKPLVVPSTTNSPSSQSDRSIAKSVSGRYGVKGSPTSSSDESSSNIYSDIEEIPDPSISKPPTQQSNPSSESALGFAFNALRRRLLHPSMTSQAPRKLPSMTEIVERPLSQMSSFLSFGSRPSTSSPVCDKQPPLSSSFSLDPMQVHEPMGFDASQHDIYEEVNERINCTEGCMDVTTSDNNNGNDEADFSSSSSSSSDSPSPSYSPARSNSPMDLASPSPAPEIIESRPSHPPPITPLSHPLPLPPPPPLVHPPLQFPYQFPPYPTRMFMGAGSMPGYPYAPTMPRLCVPLNTNQSYAPGSTSAPDIPVVNSPDEEDRDANGGDCMHEAVVVLDVGKGKAVERVEDPATEHTAGSSGVAATTANARMDNIDEALEKLEHSVTKLHSTRRKYKTHFNNDVSALSQKLAQFDDRLGEVNAEYTILFDIVDTMHHGDVPELQAQLECMLERVEELEEKERERKEQEEDEEEAKQEEEQRRAVAKDTKDADIAMAETQQEGVKQSVKVLNTLVDEMKSLRETAQHQILEELAAIKALREQVAKAALSPMEVDSSDNQTPVLPSLKRKRDDIDENGEEVVSERNGEERGGVLQSSDSTGMAMDVSSTPSASLQSIVGPPPRKRARRVASVLAQTATAFTIGAVVTWSALAFC